MFSKIIIEYNDIVAFHPGYYVQEQIETLNMSQEQLAMRMDVTPKTVSRLINGHSPMTTDLAQKLSAMFGTSMTIWMNLQNRYDELCAEIELEKNLEMEKQVLNQIDYKYFVENGLLIQIRSAVEKIKNLRDYLNVSNLNVLRNPDLLAIHKASCKEIKYKNIIPSNAWLQIVMNKANELQPRVYDETKLKFYLKEIREMTTQNPEEFYPRLLEIFEECGIIFIILPHLKNSGINGVTRWLNKDCPIVAINDRSNCSDLFWFALFHELKHVLQKKIKKVLITSSNTIELSDEDKRYELEADQFARNYLIDENEYNELIKNGISKDSILRLASKINIHPGIIIGRLQHDRIIQFKEYNYMKVKYKITID